jgi:hypothetical protein
MEMQVKVPVSIGDGFYTLEYIEELRQVIKMAELYLENLGLILGLSNFLLNTRSGAVLLDRVAQVLHKQKMVSQCTYR